MGGRGAGGGGKGGGGGGGGAIGDFELDRRPFGVERSAIISKLKGMKGKSGQFTIRSTERGPDGKYYRFSGSATFRPGKPPLVDMSNFPVGG